MVTLFPGMIREGAAYGIQGRAIESGLLLLETWNPRDYSDDKHQGVDDRPYGGGPGMVMQVEPLQAAIEDARKAAPHSKIVYLSPQGRRLDQSAVRELAQRDGMIMIAGRYEGIDERIIDRYVDEEWSIGDYVLSGGELPVLDTFF